MPLLHADQIEELRERLLLPLPELATRFLYDDRGAALFERITQLEEYYPTRTEELILEGCARDVIARVQPRALAELGSGVGRKIRLLLDEMERTARLESCLLFDINAQVLSASVQELGRLYPGLDVRGVPGDFEHDLDRLGPGGDRLILFLAGTIGNLEPKAVNAFLAGLERQMEPGDGLLIGVDQVKDTARLEAAYDDAAGVTAAFNLNILRSVNARFDADFDVDAFEHHAFYDEENAWIEMRLRATRATRVRVEAADIDLAFAPGDEIRTEISCKYTRSSFERHLPDGLVLEQWYMDAEELFALALMRREH